MIGLAVTSSTGVMSVAVGPVGFDMPMAETTIETERRHAEEISPLIKKLIEKAGVALSDLELLVVDRGPGRFTGLRVGLATVKTLAFALNVPVVGLTSLEVLAHTPTAVRHPDYAAGGNVVTAVIDARRNEVFQQMFKAGRPASDPTVGPADDLAQAASGVVVGDGLDRFAREYGRSDNKTPIHGACVDAATMLALADPKNAVPGIDIEPLYLRTPDVNPNVKTRPRL